MQYKTLRKSIETIESSDACNTLTRCPYHPSRCPTCKADRIMTKVNEWGRSNGIEMDNL